LNLLATIHKAWCKNDPQFTYRKEFWGMLSSKSLFIGERLRLAAPQSDDAVIMSRWSQDSHYQRLLEDDAIRPQAPDEVSRGGYNEFRLRTLDKDRLIGFTAIFMVTRHGSAMLAIGIGEPEYRGKGYGQEALKLIMAYGFRELNLQRLGLNVFAYNTAAIKAYERVGFVREGTRRSSILRDGIRYDEHQYGILYSEWAALYWK
jgi:RimJ/RimL family protein N-acetyltransferase